MRIVTIINKASLRWHANDPLLPSRPIVCSYLDDDCCYAGCAFFNIQTVKGKDNGLEHTAPTTQYARCKKFIIGELRD